MENWRRGAKFPFALGSKILLAALIWRYGKVLRSTSCERPSLNASVVVLFVIFYGNSFQSFIVLQKKGKFVTVFITLDLSKGLAMGRSCFV